MYDYFTNESEMRHAEFHNCDAATRKSELECDKSGSCKQEPSRRAPDVPSTISRYFITVGPTVVVRTGVRCGNAHSCHNVMS
jgi:hypothetical protein